MADGGAQFLADRRNSTARQADEAELDDVLGIFDAADAVLVLDEYFFAASVTVGCVTVREFTPSPGVVVDGAGGQRL